MTLVVLFSSHVLSSSIPNEKQISHWAQLSYRSGRAATVSIAVVTEQESQALNAQYRQKNYATNVLSFPMEMPEAIGAINERVLGDIAICADIVERQALEQSKAVIAHWAHMVVHGMLHLQGYDHEQDQDAKAMEALEIEILSGLGFQNPYSE